MNETLWKIWGFRVQIKNRKDFEKMEKELENLARRYCPHCPLLKSGKCDCPDWFRYDCKHVRLRLYNTILDRLAKEYNVSPNDIWIDDAEYVYVYYLNDKQIYVD